jgi:hypothetical protein
MKNMVQSIAGEKIRKMGRGTFCEVYRSVDNPHRIFIVQSDSYTDKEVMSHVSGDNPHLPLMNRLDSFDYGMVTYTVYETEYSVKPVKGTMAHVEYTKLRKAWDSKFVNRWNSVAADDRHTIVYDFIEYLRDNAIVSDGIIAALDSIYSWAINYDSDVWLEFPQRNLGMSADGATLILRDVFFFPPQLTQIRIARRNI